MGADSQGPGGSAKQEFRPEAIDWNRLVSAVASGNQSAEQQLVELLRDGVQAYFVHHLGIDDSTTQVKLAFATLIDSLRTGEVHPVENLLGCLLSIMQEQVKLYRSEEQPSPLEELARQQNSSSAALESLVNAVYELSPTQQQILDGLYRLGETSAETCKRLGLNKREFVFLKEQAKASVREAWRRS